LLGGPVFRGFFRQLSESFLEFQFCPNRSDQSSVKEWWK
jgi:hypothetical protein